MRVTPKLLGSLYRAFNRDPDAVGGLTVSRAAGSLSWEIEDGRLQILANDNPTDNLTLDLSAYTVGGLAAFIGAQPGYTAVVGADVDPSRTALTLIDAVGEGGQPMLSYRSLLWALVDAFGRQLTLARESIGQMVKQLRLDLAEGEWIDYWASLLVPFSRKTGESDTDMRARVIRTVLRIKTNNRALETAVLEETGIAVDVRDIDWLRPGMPLLTNQAGDVTNDYFDVTAPAYSTDPAVIAEFSLDTLPDGRPAYGPPVEGRPLRAAFAVIFGPDAVCADQKAAMAVVNAQRAAGTVPLTYRQANLFPLITNNAGRVTNNVNHVTSPSPSAFVPWVCP